jgi:putative transposase
MSFSLNALYHRLGLSKQAVSQYFIRETRFHEQLRMLEVLVRDWREEHGGCGLEKLYYQLQPDFIGRDRFVAIFQELGYGLIRRKKRPKTTFSSMYRGENLIEGMVVWAPDQVWQTDITYFEVQQTFYYLSFIIDVYSRRILSCGAYDHLRAEASEEVLKKAIKLRGGGPIQGLIHHSDHGCQYLSTAYRKRLSPNKIQASMAQIAKDNPYAERINGIIKNEYLRYKYIENLDQLRRTLKKDVRHYNTVRHHGSLGRISPVDFEKQLKNREFNPRPIVHIYSQEGPDFRKKTSFINNMEHLHPYPFCPLETNPLFYN